MRTEIKEITPEYACILLNKNTQNRTLYKYRIMSYAQDMKNGDWRATHQGIAFYEDGTLADGQHRLWAVVESNCTVPMAITWGLPREASVAIDCGKIRSVADGCKISGTHDWINNHNIACANYLFFGRSRCNQIISRADSIKHAEMIKNHLIEVYSMFLSNRKVSKACVVAAFVAARISGVPDSVLYRISEVLRTGVPLHESEHIIVKLRDMVLAARTIDMGKRYDIYKKTQRAIKAVEKNERLTMLLPQAEEIYKID